MSLVARLYVLVALAVLPAIVIQGMNELSLREDREAEIHDEAQRLAEFAASEVNGLLEGAQTLLVALARMPSIRRQEAAACNRMLGEIDQDLARYVGFAVVDRDGRWVCAQGGLAPADADGRAWPAAALAQKRLFIGTYSVSQEGGAAMLPITLPFADESGSAAGLVAVGLDLTWLHRDLAGRSMPGGASFTITDRDGTILVAIPDAAKVGRKLRADFRGMLNASGPGTLDHVAADGSRQIVGYVPPSAMLDRALLVSVGLSPEAALAPVQAATRRGVLLIGLGVALALLAAWIAGRAFILRPVSALLAAAQRWHAGDFSARVGLSGRHAEFGQLGAAFDEMAAGLEAHEREIGRTLQALRESEERFRQFAENSHDVIWIVDRRSGRTEYVSRAFAEIWGRPPEDLVEGRIEHLATVHPKDREAAAAAFARTLEGGPPPVVTYRVVRPDGQVRWVRDSGFPIRDASGAVIRVGGICRDVTELKRIEDERERVLREREVMLREINHRVKNNLQVIISLLRLQASRSASPEVREAFDEACGRVSTITELHVALFDGAQIGSLDFGAYLHELCARLEAGARSLSDGDIRIEVEAEHGAVDLDRAIPLGLIVNELVSNAIRHGFPDGRGGTVQVGFHRHDGVYRLSVRDDGAGPAGGVAALPQGLGMQLVNGFVRRVHGRLELQAGPGLEAVIDFPATRERRDEPSAPGR